jgi:predicted enzyme related to lactoylglutathione lyase
VFSPFEADTTYFAPSTKDFMINLAVDDLDGILARCAQQGVEASVFPDQPNGRFAHILDPEGTKIELWQPRPMPT